MLKFNTFVELEESFIRRALTSTLKKIRSLFKSLKFGRKVKTKISLSQFNEEIDLKSRLGYLSEYATAAALAKIINEQGLNLTSRSNPEKLNQEYIKKRDEVKNFGAKSSEIKRMEDAGANMANQIFNDIITNGEDLATLTFDIELTGDSGKGVTKADLVLTVSKDSKDEIIDKIVASLKAYKSSNINLSNSTFISLIKTIFYDSDAGLPTKSDDFIIRFAQDYGSQEDLSKLKDLQNIIGTEIKKGKSKEDARKVAKSTHGEVIEIISRVFNKYYPKNKKEINERILHMLGLDGSDDFYAAIGEAGKQKVISSRKSKQLQKMLDELSKGFELTIERNGKTNNANMFFKASNGGTIINAVNITFADTGGKNPQGKTNAFMKYSTFTENK